MHQYVVVWARDGHEYLDVMAAKSREQAAIKAQLGWRFTAGCRIVTIVDYGPVR